MRGEKFKYLIFGGIRSTNLFKQWEWGYSADTLGDTNINKTFLTSKTLQLYIDTQELCKKIERL